MKPNPANKRRTSQATIAEEPDGRDGSLGSGDDFVIVAIGASAGGLEAFTELVKALPANTGMAFVLVQHLDPTHHSMLTELVSKSTSMSVSEVKNGMKVKANHVYVIPPNCMMTIANRVLQLNPRDDVYATRMTVDHFMRSLAEDQGGRSVGVILSGSGTDGTLGLGEIQAQGGVTFAQDETTARHDGMPRSAIAAGTVDFVLPPKEIARELVRIAANRFVLPPDREEAEQEQEQAPEPHPAIHTIFQLLRKSSGVDFTYYRHTTIRRRIQRRMVVHKIETLDDYVKYLQQNPAEVKALYQDMLINVTSFFRNSTVFDSLKSLVYPAIVKNRPRDTTIRVWAPGCASGEETYSLAITVLEFLGDRASEIPVQLFGTDVNEASIIKARTGMYPENIQGDVSPERLRRYFSKTETGYRVSKTIRDMCIFAQHNVLYDPPFSQLDLICCRNVLIYLEPMLQKKIVSLFHYALRPTGFLTLGISEGVGSSTNLFSLVDRPSKIFVKKAIASHVPAGFSVDRKRGELSLNPGARATGEASWSYPDFQKECDRRLLAQYAPATVFVNQDLEVIHSRGELDAFLKLPSGRASLSILRMVREGLISDLRSAVAQATRQKGSVRRKNVVIKNGKTSQTVELEVVPLHMGNQKERYFMIVFHNAESGEREKESRAGGGRRKRKEAAQSEARDRRIARLEQELSATKEYLQSVIESQEATNEELQSANEEILSSNEELQSTNEELETAKEELQSTNEELTTVNDELRNRNTEITQVNSDLNTLLAVRGVGMVMLNNDLTIRRFTASAQKIFGLIPADVGRPFRNIKPTIDMPDIAPMIEKVVGDLSITEKDVQDHAGNWFKLRVSPYRSVDNRVDGVVITVLDVSAVATEGSEDGGGRQTGASAGVA
jgi:two-component system, chemotaxis family, CheB/CheR fusion protein